MSAPWATARHSGSRRSSTTSSPSVTDRTVSVMLVPVSPSGNRIHIEVVNSLAVLRQGAVEAGDDAAQGGRVEYKWCHGADDTHRRQGGRAPALRWRSVQGVIKSYDPVTGDGVLVNEADLADVDLADDALEGSVFRMLRQGQRVQFRLDGDGRATRLRLGSEIDMGTPKL